MVSAGGAVPVGELQLEVEGLLVVLHGLRKLLPQQVACSSVRACRLIP